MQFNERLKKLRQERGVTQKELAEAVYVSRSAVAKWESGLGLPNAESLKLLAQFFQVSEQTLLADPTVETVIVGKNGVMLRQKQIIFGLLAIFIVILTITISLFAATRRDNTLDAHKVESTLSPIVSRELIFETEKGMDVSDFPVYTIGAWGPSDDFAPSRTFEVKWNLKYVDLPNIYIREKREDGSVTYKSNLVKDNFQISRIFSATDTTFQLMSIYDSKSKCYNSIKLTVRTDNESPEFENYFNIYFEDLTMSVKIFKNTLSYESVEIVPDDGLFEVGFASSKYFSIERSAIYGGINTDGWAVIKKIRFPDNSFLSDEFEDLDSYAYIDYDTDQPLSESLKLCTSDKVPLGSKISVEAWFDYARIQTTRVFEVVRVPVTSAKILLNGESQDESSPLKMGESYNCTIQALPENATFNVLKEDFELWTKTSKIASAERKAEGWTVTISGNLSLVGEVSLSANLPEGISFSEEWQTVNPLERIEISAETLYLEKGQKESGEAYKEYYLTVRYFPENLTVYGLSFKSLDQVRGVGVYSDGRLVVAYHAEDYAQFRVQATYNGIKSNILTFTVIPPPPIEKSLTIGVGTDEVERGGLYEFSIDAKPFGAELEDVLIHLLEEIEGVYIIEGKYLFIAPTVESGTVIRIQATAEETESNVLELTVI